eukprot:4719372-Pleurochrysis_carterae.AAC.1
MRNPRKELDPRDAEPTADDCDVPLPRSPEKLPHSPTQHQVVMAVESQALAVETMTANENRALAVATMTAKRNGALGGMRPGWRR